LRYKRFQRNLEKFVGISDGVRKYTVRILNETSNLYLKKFNILFILFFLFFSDVYGEESVKVIKVEGVINPVASEYSSKGIEEASKEGAECLIIELDTPGGLDTSMRDIIKRIFSSEVPVVVYVYPSGSRAASAGVFIMLAANVAVMAPGTNIGAAHPVSIGGTMDTLSVMNEKIVNDAVAFIKTIAEKRGRNSEWAEDAVRKSVSITETEALEKNVIDFVCPNLDSLLKIIDGMELETIFGNKKISTKEASISRLAMTWRHKLLDIISNPNIAYLLMMLGMYGVLFELYSPGTILPGVVGGICLILAFFAFQTLPINFAGLLLILFAVILFIAEIKVTSYGLLSVGAVISLTLGSIMLIKSPLPFLQISLKVILPIVVVTVLFFLFAVFMVAKSQMKKPVTGAEGLVGEIGVANSTIDPEGDIYIHGEIWTAESDEKIEKGEKVEILSVAHLKAKVRKIS